MPADDLATLEASESTGMVLKTKATVFPVQYQKSKSLTPTLAPQFLVLVEKSLSS